MSLVKTLTQFYINFPRQGHEIELILVAIIPLNYTTFSFYVRSPFKKDFCKKNYNKMYDYDFRTT